MLKWICYNNFEIAVYEDTKSGENGMSIELESRIMERISNARVNKGSIRLVEGDRFENKLILSLEDADFEIETFQNFLNWNVVQMKRNNKIWRHEKFFKKYFIQIEAAMNQLNLIIVDEENKEKRRLEAIERERLRKIREQERLEAERKRKVERERLAQERREKIEAWKGRVLGVDKLKKVMRGVAYTFAAMFAFIMGGIFPSANIDGESLDTTALRAHYATLSDEMTASEKYIETLEHRLVEMESQQLAMNEVVEKTNSTLGENGILELENELERLREANEAQLNSRRGELETEYEELQQSIQNIQGEINQMKSQLEAWGN